MEISLMLGNMKFNSGRVCAVLMAGGKGTRLKPYTTYVPKPLMPIGDLPIIEVIIYQLKHYGVKDFYICIGHMAHLIQAFLGDGSRLGVNIEYSFEEQPLGTAGPIGLLKERLLKYDSFISMNGDVLTTLDYSRAISRHMESNAIATVCVNQRSVNIDFGVLEVGADGILMEYKEKPTLKYNVSMGINIFSCDVFDYIKVREFLNIPDLLINIRDSGKSVYAYEESCQWLDIGRIEDYSQACEDFETNRRLFLPHE
ncbi:sugar phosphate nucleotidyltransferase [Bdellovibrio bacteriovorus]|uniref:sugar phosphate nucleotidyltransferase n=1 Tax=Bdellovibrio bacteriovorus TaxID=959 RepID=UPI0021CFA273|nr:sugar phosphate nucleotidyltransferase [Bdellovibrio bacteriovorus]UXR63787.1 sugar phosphate nucleotidyltransferase [Bdellovibrio bacteriovorus]